VIPTPSLKRRRDLAYSSLGTYELFIPETKTLFRSRNVIFNEAGLSKEEFDKIALHQFASKPITPDIPYENE